MNRIEDIFDFAFGEPYKIIVGANTISGKAIIDNSKRKALLNTIKATQTAAKFVTNYKGIDSAMIKMLFSVLATSYHLSINESNDFNLLTTEQIEEYQNAYTILMSKLEEVQQSITSALNTKIAMCSPINR